MIKNTTTRVKQSMLSMLITRPLSAVAGLVVLVLLSRGLKSTEYAIYFAVWAVAEIVILASNCGLIQSVYRYVSAAQKTNGCYVVEGPVLKLIALRFLSLILSGGILLSFPDLFVRVFSGAHFSSVLVLYVLAISICEGMARFFESIFDSMLSQGRSQFTLLLRTLVRVVGLLYLGYQDGLTIENVIRLEMIAASLGFFVGFILFAQLYVASELGSTELHEGTLVRMVKFAVPAYMAQLLGILYGPDAMKLILAGNVGAHALAVFGFAYSLAAVVQRYLPINILAGVFRPVFVAASKKEDANHILPEMLVMVIKVNWLFVVPIFCILIFLGDWFLGKISGGNYTNAGPVMCIIVVALLAVATHGALSMYCLARETSWAPMWATACSAVGLPIAIYLGGRYGAIGVALAFLVSEIIWCFACYLILQINQVHRFTLPIRGLLVIVGSVTTAVALPLAFNHWFSPVLSAVVAILVLLILLIKFSPFSSLEQKWLTSVCPAPLAKILRL